MSSAKKRLRRQRCLRRRLRPEGKVPLSEKERRDNNPRHRAFGHVTAMVGCPFPRRGEPFLEQRDLKQARESWDSFAQPWEGLPPREARRTAGKKWSRGPVLAEKIGPDFGPIFCARGPFSGPGGRFSGSNSGPKK